MDVSIDEQSGTPDAPTLIIDAAHRINFASAQNAVPVLRSLRIENPTDHALDSITVTLGAHPAFCREKRWTVDRIAAGSSVEITDRELVFDLARLAELNEAEHGALIFTLDLGDGTLIQETSPVELLARDEWGGLSDMSQTLAAFVSPNDPAAARILKQASRLLASAGHPDSLEGYQNDNPARAYMLAAAVWSAITGMGLSYANPPASFEIEGQKIRDPGRIETEGLATCLDTVLLACAALEAVGLNPVAIFTTGHAMCGVWLRQQSFRRIFEPDVMELRKAIAAREFIVFETTLLTKRPAVGFEQAISDGRSQLAEERETEFQGAVDITRARGAGIRPLATHRTPSEESSDPQDDETAPAALPKQPEFGLPPGELIDEKPQTPRGRIERWRSKLLDLSLRNRLLNFAATKQTIPFICPDPARLEDHLAAGGKMRLIALKEDDPVAERDPELFRQTNGKDIEAEFAAAAQSRNEICVPLTPKDMKGRLTTLYRKAKSDLAEGGANTLFLAVGFLRWKKSATNDRVYRAPLLMLPVKLERKSANSDFYLSPHEDDMRMNATLLQFLERDFGVTVPGLAESLPEDHSGVDVPLVLETMRRLVRDIPGFEVVEEVALSNFSFAKYLMWKDLTDRQHHLRENRLVRHLIDSPEAPFQTTGAMPEPRDIDRRIAPADLLTPLPADSSQLAAVVAAASGRDFVIIGPPGTGKSQTIANMIAHCMAKGKSVLFVAEKSAALDVVYRRLCAYGLGELCLELHSNKSDRKRVISQLGAAWERASEAADQDWITINTDLKIHRDQLNDYVHALHEKGSHGWSVFEAIGETAAAKAPFALSFAAVDAHDAESFNALRRLAEEVGRTREAAPDCAAFDSIDHDDWSFSWEARVFDAVADVRRKLEPLRQSAERLSKAVGLSPDPQVDKARLGLLTQFATAFCNAEVGDHRLALDDAFDDLAAGMDGLEASVKVVRRERAALCASYREENVARMPLEDLDRDWREANAQFWLSGFFAKRRVRAFLQSYAESGRADPATDLSALLTLRAQLDEISSSVLNIAPGFAGADTDLDNLRQYLERVGALRAAAQALSRSDANGGRLRERLAAFLSDGADHDVVARAAESLLIDRVAFEEALHALRAVLAGWSEPETLEALSVWLDALEAQRVRLQDWTKWVGVRRRAAAQGLEPLVEAVERGEVADAQSAFQAAYFQWWLPLALDQSPPLRTFSHWEQADKIAQFRKLDEAARELAAAQVRRKAAHDLPAQDSAPRKSELGVLRHQLGLQRPSVSIRALIGRMPSSFAKLTPCVLMSPLSIAQYLPTEHAHFDMVIFDEASQITTWDAVGAIARGRQSIIVGDPKQLPPTNFFGRADAGDDEDLAFYEQDLESILDEAEAAGLPTHQLNWHYRSRDEALIAFSNHHYYGDRLVTFPSPATRSDALRLHRIDGIYARGEGRFNQIEAKALADYAVSRLTEWLDLPETERQTLGVITFNTQQQELILDLLDAARRENPALEWFFEDAREEPVIVKNLENIQGDERDVMLFSITFAPDKAGKLSMNFGALNRDGGEKRLNVAVTRARGELHVFASIASEQIDTSRTQAIGVKHLKNFLDYAERGPIALPGMDHGSLGDAESPFEAAVAEALRQRGWEVRTQIGVSGFRIDLGVVHPDQAGAYLAGVECDGATYHRSATARDRDATREAVLRNLGWEILRIWSTDWFRNAEETCARTDASLRELLEESRARMAREAEKRAEAEKRKAAAEEKRRADLAKQAVDAQAEAGPAPEAAAHRQIQPDVAPPLRVLEPEAAQRRVARLEPARLEESSAPIELPPPADEVDAARFYDPDYTPILERLISAVVIAEGPLPQNKLARRIARLFGWSRAGNRIRDRVLSCLGANESHGPENAAFVWPPGAYVEYAPFRRDLERSPRDICPEEIRGLILANPTILSSDDPARKLAELMAISRLTSDARVYLESVLNDSRA